MSFSSRKTFLISALLITQFSLGIGAFAQTNTMTSGWLWDDLTTSSETTATAVSTKTLDEVIQPTLKTTTESKTLYSFNVDTQKIQQERLGWVNYERSIRGLQTLQLDETLNNTAIERANYLWNNRKFTKYHQRPWQTCANYWCYDPGQRFLERGVSQYAGETVLYGGYRCGQDDCTDTLIDAAKWYMGGPSGFLGLIIGEMSYNGVHYRMMLNPKITKIGVGFAKSTHGWFGGAYMGVIHYE